MILKLQTREVAGFVYVDGIESFEVANIPNARIHYEKVHLMGPFVDTILYHHTMDKESGHVECNDSVGTDRGGALYVLTVRKSDGTPVFYLTDLSIYVMSDAGKTIERIN